MQSERPNQRDEGSFGVNRLQFSRLGKAEAGSAEKKIPIIQSHDGNKARRLRQNKDRT